MQVFWIVILASVLYTLFINLFTEYTYKIRRISRNDILKIPKFP